MKPTCKFCQKFGGPTGKKQTCDHILFESENFVVVPTIGSIVPGWLLVVPRSHSLSIGSLDEVHFQELTALQRIAAEALQDCFGPVTFFEHGAVRERETVGCGVDHAHLHILGTKLDLWADAKAAGETKLGWRRVLGVQATTACVAEQMPYVFAESPSDGAWIGTASDIESQFMRKIIATSAGCPNCWDWKTNSFEYNATETVMKVEAWKAARLRKTVAA